VRPLNRVTTPAADRPGPGLDTFEEERREVLDSVFAAICEHPPDPDEMAACAYLVRHLARGADNATP
jgi:hypothetical protein